MILTQRQAPNCHYCQEYKPQGTEWIALYRENRYPVEFSIHPATLVLQVNRENKLILLIVEYHF